MRDYHVNVFHSEEDGGHIANIPDLKHCSAFGTTPREALNEVLKAEEAWLEATRAYGKPIALPRYRPLIYQLPDCPYRYLCLPIESRVPVPAGWDPH